MARLRAGVAWCLATDPRYRLTCGACSVGVCLLLAVGRGQDWNWDQRNYHIATPYLLLHGGFWESVAPAGIQSWLNPSLLLAQFVLIESLPPVLAAVVIALAQSVAFMLAALICAQVAPPDERGHVAAFLGFLLCLASPMALSEIGTTYIDLLTAVPVLLGFWLLTCDGPVRGKALAAGLLLGLATGWKLTSAIYVLSAGGFRLATPAARRLQDLAWLGCGVAAGLLASAGSWHWALWRRYANPLFPFANGLFGSPDFPAINLADARFPARSIWDFVRYPYVWLAGGGGRAGLLSPTSEVTLHDARFVLALLGLGGLALAWRRWARLRGGGLAAAWLIAYVAWLYGFGIHRYAVGIEILLGAVILACAGTIVDLRRRIFVLAACVIVTLGRFMCRTGAICPGPEVGKALPQPQ